jgi:hypothetical protein
MQVDAGETERHPETGRDATVASINVNLEPKFPCRFRARGSMAGR